MSGVQEESNSLPSSEDIRIQFPGVLYERFDRLCRKKGFEKGEIIRSLVDDFVQNNSDELNETELSSQLEAF